MANHTSALKRIRSNKKKYAQNRYQLKTCRTFVKKLQRTTEPQQATILLTQVSSMLDKLAKRHIIHKNKSANSKSKLAQYVHSLRKRQLGA